jgi:predicted O-methyltransferase YrrM
MAVTTVIKNAINRVLSSANLRIDSLTADTIETGRIERQKAIGQFDRPVFPLLDGMASFNGKPLVDSFAAYRTDMERMMSGASPGRFDRVNTFYSTPDAEVLYLMIRSLAPKRIVEVGSGNSTRIIRQAIADGQLKVNHVAIDPEPRAEISGLSDRILRQRYEETDLSEELYALDVNDVLFIDSSHLVHVANDVTKLFCNAIPALRPGVAVHVHDVFLPFDYPEPFCTNYSGWGEQYLLQVMLAARPREILWPGYYVQKQRPELCEGLPFLASGRAQSFWFRT